RQPTMSGTVATLVTRGWVTKETDPQDARASLVTLTAGGREALAVVRHRNAEAVATVGTDHQNLTAEDLATAVRVLREVLQATTEGPHSPACAPPSIPPDPPGASRVPSGRSPSPASSPSWASASWTRSSSP